jgi:hypothetical protein
MLKKSLLLICAAVLAGTALAGAGCAKDSRGKEISSKEEAYWEGFIPGKDCGRQYGRADKEQYKKDGTLEYGRRPPSVETPWYITDEEMFQKAFATGFYEGYDEEWPEYNFSVKPGGQKEAAKPEAHEEAAETVPQEELEIEDLDIEILDEYSLGFNDGKLAGHNAGFDAGAYGAHTEKPANVGMSEDYLRGFNDGWADGYPEGYQEGVWWKELNKSGG